MSCSATVVVDSNCVAMAARRTCGCAISLRCNTKLATRTIFTAIWVSITIRAVCALHMGMAAGAITTSTVIMASQLPDSYAVRFQI